MQRLVYSPSVSAYVQTETGIIDLTDFIVSGSVNRVLNEVSTAELTFRNPYKQFTLPEGEPTFRPMDGITIFASRYRNKPVQIFTGYLDETPYLQLFPGTVTIRASCTLKRLLHTYFDAGLPYTIEFLQKFGWEPNLQTGTIFSPAGQSRDSKIKIEGDIKEKELNDALLTDGTIGNLLWNVLFEMGNWDKDSILIEKLPDGIIKTVSDIMRTFEKDDDETLKELEQFFEDLVGEYTGGSAPGGGGTLNVDGKSPPMGSVVTPEQVAVEMLRQGFPADAKVIASGIETMEHESGFGTAAGWDAEHDGGVLGYWQIQRSSHNVSADCCMTLSCSTKAALGIWKAAGGCFACQWGPNPWQGGTDNGTKYRGLAEKVIAQVKQGKTPGKQQRDTGAKTS